MHDFADVAFVWCGDSWVNIGNRPGPDPAPLCTVAAWPMALGCDVLGWDGGKASAVPKAKLRQYRVLLVNLFDISRHVKQIRAAHPDAYIVAMPDPYLEIVLYGDPPRILEQLAYADAIGGRTPHDVAVYGALFDKPAVWLPSPIGPAEAFRAAWGEAKRDVLIATEHHWQPNSSAATVAALAAIQRQNGAAVHFYGATSKTRRIAELAGLRAEWRERIPYPDMVRETARARWGVDLYAGHAQGRNLQTHAMVGTPVMGSRTNNPMGVEMADPYCPGEAAERVLAAWDGPAYEERRQRAREYVEATYGFDASRRRLSAFLETL